jgi:hypothetical protein
MRIGARAERIGVSLMLPVQGLMMTLALALSGGCASPRQAAGVGLVALGALTAAVGLAAADVVQETSDPRDPTRRRCLDGCGGSDSAVDALLVAGGAATALAGEALLQSDPASRPKRAATGRAPAAASTVAPAAPAPAPIALPFPPAAASAPAATAVPASSPAGPAPSGATRCLGPLRDPVAAGCGR